LEITIPRYYLQYRGAFSSREKPVGIGILSGLKNNGRTGRERREAEKELEMQEKKKLNRMGKFDESMDSFGFQWQFRNCHCWSCQNVESTRSCNKGFLLTHILVNKSKK